MSPKTCAMSGLLAAVAAAAILMLAVLLAVPSAARAAETVGTVSYQVASGTVSTDYDSVDGLFDGMESAVSAAGGSEVTVSLACDVNTKYYGRIVVPSGSNVTLELNGHMINRDKALSFGDMWYGESECDVIHVNAGATLTVNGGEGDAAEVAHAGTLMDESSGNYYFWKYGGTGSCTIYGGLITGGAGDNQYGGGGISTEGEAAKVYLNHVTVAGNLADQKSGYYGHGAGVAVHGANSILELNDAHIVYNHAEGYGGGIYLRSSGTRLTVYGGSEVSHNLGVLEGGGIYVDGNDVQAIVRESSHIDSNRTDGDGGGVYHNGKRGTLALWDGSSIDRNTAQGDGGGIYDYYNGTTFNLNASSVSYNKARESDSDGEGGGGLYLNDQAELSLLNGASISYNTAGYGAGVYAGDDGTTIRIQYGSQVSHNTAATEGGGIYCSGDSSMYYRGDPIYIYLVDNAMLSCNQAKYGGGIGLNSTAHIVVNGSEISHNKAEDGAGIYDAPWDKGADASDIVLTHSGQICENEAQYRGGGIYRGKNPSYALLVKSSDGTGSIRANSAGTYGGGIYLYSDGSLTKVNICDNTAAYGAGVYRGANLALDQVTVTGNVATKAYGGVGGLSPFAGGTASKLTLQGKLVIEGNTAKGKASNLCLGCSESVWRYEGDKYYDMFDDAYLLKVVTTSDAHPSSGSRIGVNIDDFQAKYTAKFASGNFLDDIGDGYAESVFSDDPLFSVGRDDDTLYLYGTPSKYTVTLVGLDSGPVRVEAEYGSTVTVKSGDYAIDGVEPVRWTVDGLGAAAALVPVDGQISFVMPGNDVKLTAVYSKLDGVELGIRDDAERDGLGPDAAVSSLKLVSADGRQKELPVDSDTFDARIASWEASEVLGGVKTLTYTVRVPRHLAEDLGMCVEADGVCQASAKVYTRYGTFADDSCEVEVGEEDVTLTVTADIPASKSDMTNVTVSLVDINQPEKQLDAYVFELPKQAVALTSPTLSGWEFAGWDESSLPEDAEVDEDGTLMLAQVADGTELVAKFVPAVGTVSLELGSLTVGSAFPGDVSASASDTAGAALSSSGATVTWARSDGAELDEVVESCTTYVATVRFTLAGEDGHRFTMPVVPDVTAAGATLETASAWAAGTSWTVEAVVSVTSPDDNRFKELLTDLSDVEVLVACDYLDQLPFVARYSMMSGAVGSADISWEKVGDVEQITSGSFEATGVFVDESGQTHQVSRRFTVVAPDAPSASPQPGTYVSAQSVALSATGLAARDERTTLHWCLVEPGTDAESVPLSSYSVYEGPIEVEADATLLAYAAVDGGGTSEVASFAYSVRTLHAVSVEGGRALNADGDDLEGESVTNGAEVRLVAAEPDEGMAFAGWVVASPQDLALADASCADTTFTMPAADVYVQATYKALTCEVTFDSAGGTQISAQPVKWGEAATEPSPAPTRDGYTFQGWYAGEALTQAYDFTAAVTSDLTLYAKWDEVPAPSPDPEPEPTPDPAPTSFSDVTFDKWYYGWVGQAASRGLMSGYKDADGKYTGLFGPEDQLTRAQVAIVIWRMAGSPEAGYTGKFPDVAEGAWYAQAVEWCAAQGIVTGYTGGVNAGTYQPDGYVTREELAVMVYRYAKSVGAVSADIPTANFDRCRDAASVAGWSHDAMVWCAAAGVITGKELPGGYFLDPQAGATRAEAAKVFTRVDALVKGEIDPYSLDDLIEEGAVEEAQALADGAEVSEEQPAFEPVDSTEPTDSEEPTFDDVALAESQTAAVAELPTTDATPAGSTASTDDASEAVSSGEALSDVDSLDAVTAQAA